MGLEVKQRLASDGEEWLRLRCAAKMIDKGRFDTETIVFDTQGRMVALSHQVAMAVDMTRNYDKRPKDELDGLWFH
ncbi:hypothetical protein NQ176_g8275 [Zarea fungicola]|uniref:Uncharacterized protein n=1 Tax=Zarea fungicola TaxID=93591 RepID=A0ACC1MV59_9HYPO|nr:hypothetical protein NQ176_g8275 [Lecanicillium fungicola]